jgi:hypothetical protein
MDVDPEHLLGIVVIRDLVPGLVRAVSREQQEETAIVRQRRFRGERYEDALR